MQGLAAEGAVDDLALRVNEDIVGDAVNHIGRCGGTLPTLQLGDLLTANPVVDGIALDEVVLQDMVGPLAKLHTTFRINTIADRDDHVQIIEWNNALYCSFTFNLNLCFFAQVDSLSNSSTL